MPPNNGSGSATSSGGTTTAQLTRQLADQMRQVQDTVAALADDNATLKAKVAVLEASVERLQGQGGAARKMQRPAPQAARHRGPPAARRTAAAAARPRGRSPTLAGTQSANSSRAPRGQRGRGGGAGGATDTQTLLPGRLSVSASATPAATPGSPVAGDTSGSLALPPRNAAGSGVNPVEAQARAAARTLSAGTRAAAAAPTLPRAQATAPHRGRGVRRPTQTPPRR